MKRPSRIAPESVVPSRPLSRAEKGLAVFFGVFSAAGLALALYGGNLVVDAYRMHGWEPIDAVVLDHRVIPSTRAELGEATFRPSVRYRYQAADGILRTSNRFDLDRGTTGDEATLRARLETEFSVGKIIRIHHNPKNPADAVIEGASLSRPLWVVGTGAVLFLLGLVNCRQTLKGAAPRFRRQAK